MDDEVIIKLSHDQAFVLSHWLYEVENSGELDAVVRDRAIWSPLRAIAGTLETSLAEIFMPDYSRQLEAAKERLVDATYGDSDEAPEADATS